MTHRLHILYIYNMCIYMCIQQSDAWLWSCPKMGGFSLFHRETDDWPPRNL